MSSEGGGDPPPHPFDDEDGDSGSEDGATGEDNNNSRKRKAPTEPPTAAEEAATATLMSLPRKLSQKTRDGEEGSFKSEDSDVDLTTVEGKSPSPAVMYCNNRLPAAICLTSVFHITRSAKRESKHVYRGGTIPGKCLYTCFCVQMTLS